MSFVIVRPQRGNPGGAKLRSAQIENHLGKIGDRSPAVVSPLPVGALSIGRLTVEILKNSPALIARLFSTSDARAKLSARIIARRVAQQLTIASGPPDIIAWETNAGAYLHLGRELKSLWPNVPLVAFPHNIESLVPGKHNDHAGRRLIEEVNALRSADLVVSISEFDAKLLALLGLKAICLPFVPDECRMELLERIKDLRAKTEKSYILILGSAQNRPTAIGMTAQFEFIRQFFPNERFVLAGYRVDDLSVKAPENVEIISSPDDERLEKILAGARCLWCHQPATTGVLTRVVEAAICGIPIVANAHAALEYSDIPSVRVYHEVAADLFANIDATVDVKEKLPESFGERARAFSREIDLLMAVN